MNCKGVNCLECPLEKCIHDSAELPKKPAEPKSRKAYHRQYYLEHRDEIRVKAHRRYLQRKYG